jgi:hypothetical protein
MGKKEIRVKYFFIDASRFCLWQSRPLLPREKRPLLGIGSLSKNFFWDFWQNKKNLCMDNTMWYNMSSKKFSAEQIILPLPQKEG